MREISVNELQLNPMTMFGRDWCLIGAGNEQRGFNAMTVAWGQLGAIWDRKTPEGKKIIPTATVFIRPQRYTREFFDREELFTICAFEPNQGMKKALAYMGTHSGREGDKAAKAGLTPVFAEDTTYFQEASMVFICRKLYHMPLQENGFAEKQIVTENYPQKDFHEVYVGEIVKVLIKETDAQQGGGISCLQE